jgi:ABC-type Fe3+/spermidine/putrescine transport system ATPase subunit
MSYLVVSQLSKRFGTVEALQGVSFHVDKGELFYLLGASGCGKSTLLSIIAGLEQPDAGSVVLDGTDLLSVPAHKRTIHTIFQNYCLFPHLTVADNIGFALKVRGVSSKVMQQRITETAAIVSLPDVLTRYPHQLSGGQQQRVAIARAIINQPSLLLLDEPYGALDAMLKRELQQELRVLQRRLGMSFLCVTHDQEEALSTADRIAIMRDGVIEQVGTPQDVYHAPQTAFVASFIGTINFLTDRDVIRPEKIHILEDAATTFSHSLAGIVTQRTFRGSAEELQITCDAQRLITASVVPGSLRQQYDIGSPIKIAWHDGDVHRLTHTGASQ